MLKSSASSFGGGNIAPLVSVHLKKAKNATPQQVGAKKPVTQIGGGNISPAVQRHLKKA